MNIRAVNEDTDIRAFTANCYLKLPFSALSAFFLLLKSQRRSSRGSCHQADPGSTSVRITGIRHVLARGGLPAGTAAGRRRGLKVLSLWTRRQSPYCSSSSSSAGELCVPVPE